MRHIVHIVVGVDSSDCSQQALDWATHEAASHGARLTAVTAWELPTVPMTAMYPVLPWGDVDVDPDRHVRWTQSMLEKLIADSGVEADCTVAHGAPAKVLIDRSSDADVLVMGSRGHGGLAGMLLGSVSQHVAAHAKCPVVIVR